MKKPKSKIPATSIFSLIIIGLFFFSCLPRKVIVPKVPSFSFSILYGANLSYKDLPKFLYAKKNLEKDGPVLTLLDSKIFRGDFLYFGEKPFIFSLIKILNKIGLDAILVTSDFLPIFQKMGREVLDSSHFFFLASNLFKGEGREQIKKTIFHPLLTKNLNDKKITLLHTLPPTSVLFTGYYWEDETTYLKKKIPLLKTKSQFIGCISTGLGNFSLPCFFIEKPPKYSLIRYQVTGTGDNFRVEAETISFSNEEESLQEEILVLEKEINSFFDNHFLEIKENFSQKRLTDLLVDFVLRKTKGDFLIMEKPIGRDLKKGKLPRRAIWETLGVPGFLMVTNLSRLEMERLGKEGDLLIFPQGKKEIKSSYRVVMTESIHHWDGVFRNQFSYLPYTFFELAIEFLAMKK